MLVHYIFVSHLQTCRCTLWQWPCGPAAARPAARRPAPAAGTVVVGCCCVGCCVMMQQQSRLSAQICARVIITVICGVKHMCTDSEQKAHACIRAYALHAGAGGCTHRTRAPARPGERTVCSGSSGRPPWPTPPGRGTAGCYGVVVVVVRCRHRKTAQSVSKVRASMILV